MGIAQIAYVREAFAESAMLVEFVKGHEAVNPDVEARLNGAQFDFDAALSADELQLARNEPSRMTLDEVAERYSEAT